MPVLTLKVEADLLDGLNQLAARSLSKSRSELVRRALWRLVREGKRSGRVASPDAEGKRLKSRRSQRKLRQRTWEVVLTPPAA